VTLDTLQQLIAIIFIDLSLSADNALVIGLAARELAPAHRRTAILVGGALAVGLRVLLTALAAVLLTIPYLQLIGGVALFVIAYRLARPGSHDGGVRPAASLRGAIGMIVVADLTTSLEHVLGIGGAAHGDVLLLLIGLGISIPIVLAGSGFVASIVGRFPWTIWLGVIALVWTGRRSLPGRSVHQHPPRPSLVRRRRIRRRDRRRHLREHAPQAAGCGT